MNRLVSRVGLLCMLGPCLLSNYAYAGAFVFAGETNGVDVVTHSSGYTGSGGTLDVNVCINPASPNAASMVVPVKNIISVWNARNVTTNNLVSGGANNVPASSVDFESVALHEVGHCIGLAHPNLGSQAGVGGSDSNYTMTTNGIDNIFNLTIGADAVRGSSDDTRGDDVNLHWFRNTDNDPFAALGATIDTSTYSRDTASLPGGAIFAANADRAVSALLGYGDTEAVMNQGSVFDEAQRTLAADDVATLRLAMAGNDGIQGNADDYSVNLTYGGLSTGCDLVLHFDDAETGFAVCKLGGSFNNATHARITSANAYFNTGFSWFFNNQLMEPEAGDLNADGQFDSQDIAVMMSRWGGSDADADLNSNGMVDAADLQMLLDKL